MTAAGDGAATPLGYGGGDQGGGEGWRGGTALLSVGTAKKRMAARLDDAREWGGYVGRLYTREKGNEASLSSKRTRR